MGEKEEGGSGGFNLSKFVVAGVQAPLIVAALDRIKDKLKKGEYDRGFWRDVVFVAGSLLLFAYFYGDDVMAALSGGDEGDSDEDGPEAE